MPRRAPIKEEDAPPMPVKTSHWNLYRTYRIVRFLLRKGTLFRKPEFKRAQVRLVEKEASKNQKNKSSSYRIYRKIRYLLWKGSLFSRRQNLSKRGNQTLPVPVKRISFTALAYRKLRFLITTGKIFKRPKPITPAHPVLTPRNYPGVRERHSFSPATVTYRKLRFLIVTGRLFKPRPKRESKIVIRSFATIETPKIPFSRKLYVAYRKGRFLFVTGRIFKPKKIPKFSIRKLLRIFRKVKYLARYGDIYLYKPGQLRRYIAGRFNFFRKKQNLEIMVTSTMLFLLAYFTIYLLTNYATVLMAASHKINTAIYDFKIDYLIQRDDWKRNAIIEVFSIGPFVALGVSLIALILYSLVAYQRWILNFFLLWIMCHGLTFFFGGMTVGTLFSKGFGFAFNWQFNASPYLFLIILAGVFFMIIIGLLFTRLFLISGNIYFCEIDDSNRKTFIKAQFIFPYIIGTLIATALQYPTLNIYDLFVNLSMGMIIFPFSARGWNYINLRLSEDNGTTKIHWWILVIVFVLLFFVKLLFQE